jgi:TolB-like protein/Tfp pilus assembly protein PilF
MSSFLGELKRRSVFKVAVTYGIVAWLLIEVTTTVLPTFEAPEWIAQVFTFFIILGFPVALVLSWAYDLTPQGIERTGAAPESDAQSGDSTKSKGAGPKLEYAVIGTLALALVFVLFNRYAPDDESVSGDAGGGAAPSVTEPSGPAANAAPSPTLLPNSVAVLPFENLSPDPDNAYFAAGIHEEILNQLAKIRSLNIIARTTMLQYAARDRSIPEIAAELNVETVMEGSVRYADGRVLITAQLIDPVTNAHLWSESYNREFADIFAIQADVAMNIANALEAEFSVAEQERIEKLPTESLEAYSLYLRAMQEGPVFGSQMDNYLGEAIELDPQFALALGTRASLYALWTNFASYGGEIARGWERQVLEDAERALTIDPELSVAHVAMAILDQSSWRAADARLGYERALALRPNDPTALIWYARLEDHFGDADAALDKIQRGLTLDPGNFLGRIFLGNLRFAARNYDEASAAYREALRISPTGPYPILMTAFIAIHRGDNEEALNALRVAESFLADSVFLLPNVALAYSRAGAPQEAQRIFSTLEERDDRADESVSTAGWAIAYMAIGDYDEALTRLTESIDNNESGAYDQLNQIQSNFFDDPVLENDPRFLEQRARLQFDL